MKNIPSHQPTKIRIFNFLLTELNAKSPVRDLIKKETEISIR
jgi:hypothetical protein